MLDITNWKPGTVHPEKSGDYLCLIIDSYFSTIGYSAKNSCWNAYDHHDQEKLLKSAFSDSDVTAWTEQADLKDMLNKQFGVKKEEMT